LCVERFKLLWIGLKRQQWSCKENQLHGVFSKDHYIYIIYFQDTHLLLLTPCSVNDLRCGNGAGYYTLTELFYRCWPCVYFYMMPRTWHALAKFINIKFAWEIHNSPRERRVFQRNRSRFSCFEIILVGVQNSVCAHAHYKQPW
jgi:hypothetical protein